MGLDQMSDQGQLNPKDLHAAQKTTQDLHAADKTTQVSTMYEKSMGDYFVGVSEQKEGKNPQVYMRSVDHPCDKDAPKCHHERPPPVGIPAKPTGEIRPCVLEHKTSDSNNQSALKAQVNKCTKRVEDLAEHLKLGASVSDTVKGKLSLGAKIIRKRGRENLFKEQFHCDGDEKLLKASTCYLSTTTGPIGGLLFISTKKLAFCSDRALAFTCPSGGVAWSYYRVSIPVAKVSSASTYENVNKPAEKYIGITTVDNWEFWFVGFVKLNKAFKHIQEALQSK